eukprot:gene10243-8160_t
MLARKHSVIQGNSPRLLKSYNAIAFRRPARIIRPAVADVEAPLAEPAPEPPQPSTVEVEQEEKAFPYPLPLDQYQQKLSSIPMGLFYPALAACVGGSAFIGYAGVKAAPVPLEDNIKEMVCLGTAAALGAAAAAASVQAKKKRDSAAVIELYNKIVELPEPTKLSPQVVSGVESNYGISMAKDELSGLQMIYSQYLESLIPLEEKVLRGDEAPKIKTFMEALGLSLEDVAYVHLDLGRKLFRVGTETRDRQVKFEQRKAFQALVYVSASVFGDQKMATLLPWKEDFNLNDAQMYVARRDNATAIFKAHLNSNGGHIHADVEFLRELREYQLKVKMMDESSEDMVKVLTRKDVEDRLVKCLEIMKSVVSSRNVAGLVEEIDAVIKYSRDLRDVAGEDGIIPGIAAPTIAGGHLADKVTGKPRECPLNQRLQPIVVLKDVYKCYLGERLDLLGEFSQALDDDLVVLEAVLCLPSKETRLLRDETSSRLYKKLLREEVVSKRIDEAADPADVLKSLCEKVRFSPEAATELHKQLYKQKIGAILDERKEFNAQDIEDLARVRRVLCISNSVAKRAIRETCGKELEEIFSDIFLMGAKPILDQDFNRMDAIVSGLRITPDIAMEILKAMTVEKFRSYVKAAQKEAWDRKAAALTMKKLVQFNTLVVTPLVEHVKGYAEGGSADVTVAVPASYSRKATQLSTASALLRTFQCPSRAGEFFEEERVGQTEINLKGDMEPASAAVMYKQYMLYAMAGETVTLPAGGMIRKKNSRTTQHIEAVRLAQVGGILGMTMTEMDATRAELSEDAYKEQVLEVTRSGAMTEESKEYLQELRMKMGVSKEAGERILKAVRMELSGNAAAEEENGGRWTLERAIQFHKAGGSAETVMEEVTRRNLFRREFTHAVSDGTGNLDADYLLKKLPEILDLPPRKVAMIVKELAGTRRRMLLVQAVSQLRSKRGGDAAKSLNNLISCCKAIPEKEPMLWNEMQELLDLYQAYCETEANAEKRSVLQSVLGLTDEEASDLSAASKADDVARVAINSDDEGFF